MKILDIPKEYRREKGRESLFTQIVDESFPNLWKELDPEIQGANRTPKNLNLKRPSSMHIILRPSKINDRERILEVAKENMKVTCKGKSIRLSSNFSAEILQASRK